MNRKQIIYQIGLLEDQCKGCLKDCDGCKTNSMIRHLGKQLETIKKERKPLNEKVVLDEQSYNNFKLLGKSDAEIARQFGIKQATLIYYKKKWEKEATTSDTAVTTDEKKPCEGKCSREGKTAEYEALIKELKEQVKNQEETSVMFSQRIADTIREYRGKINDLKIETDEQITSLSEEKERLLDENNLLINENRKLDTIIENQKYQLGCYAKENEEMQEEIEALKYFARKYLVN